MLLDSNLQLHDGSLRSFWSYLKYGDRTRTAVVVQKSRAAGAYNQDTIIASNRKGNPQGKYTTVGIYYIVQQSDVYLVYALSIRYTSDPVPFENIYHWVYPRAYDIVAEHAPREAFVVDVIALTFEKTDPKPDKIEVKP